MSVCNSVVVRRIKSGLVLVCSSDKGPVVDNRQWMDLYYGWNSARRRGGSGKTK